LSFNSLPLIGNSSSPFLSATVLKTIDVPNGSRSWRGEGEEYGKGEKHSEGEEHGKGEKA
jgi:hypothetical protein